MEPQLVTFTHETDLASLVESVRLLASLVGVVSYGLGMLVGARMVG